MSALSIGQRADLERVLLSSPAVRAALEQDERERAETRRAAIEAYHAADARLAAAQGVQESKLPELDAELARLTAKFEMQQQKLAGAAQSIREEVAIAQALVFNATLAINRLPRLTRFEEWLRRASRAMELSSPRVPVRPTRKQFRSESHFEQALERWKAEAAALTAQIDETARAVRAVFQMAPFNHASDDEAIAASKRALQTFQALVTWPSNEQIDAAFAPPK